MGLDVEPLMQVVQQFAAADLGGDPEAFFRKLMVAGPQGQPLVEKWVASACDLFGMPASETSIQAQPGELAQALDERDRAVDRAGRHRPAGVDRGDRRRSAVPRRRRQAGRQVVSELSQERSSISWPKPAAGSPARRPRPCRSLAGTDPQRQGPAAHAAGPGQRVPAVLPPAAVRAGGAAGRADRPLAAKPRRRRARRDGRFAARAGSSGGAVSGRRRVRAAPPAAAAEVSAMRYVAWPAAEGGRGAAGQADRRATHAGVFANQGGLRAVVTHRRRDARATWWR